MSRSAKVARVIPLETPDNSSSEDEDELEELQVIYFKEQQLFQTKTEPFFKMCLGA